MGMLCNFMALPDEQVRQLSSGAVQVSALEESGAESCALDLGWSAVAFFMGLEGPARLVVPMGEEFAQKGTGLPHGASLLTAEQVGEAASFLSGLDREALRQRLQRADDEDGLTLLLGDEDPDELWAYWMEDLDMLQGFYADAAGRGQQVLFYVL